MAFDSVPGPAGGLQALVELPEGPPRALGVICHPHPLHGGTLNNKIVHQLARTFNQLGAVSVRFNFRGVGDSEGAYADGRGELQDLLAVADWASRRWPALPLWLGGFSFGGFIAMQASGRLQPQRLVAVAPAVNYFDAQSQPVAAGEWLLIQGSDDDIVPLADVQAFVQRQPVPPSLITLEGAGHFFHGRLNELRQAIADAFVDR